jgi:4-amino-4-deoxy-L-arabinose transferase-like glycosyltransferase
MSQSVPVPGNPLDRLFSTSRPALFLLIATLALAFFWQLGTPPLYDLDEGAFTEATREMIASGNYVTPHKDGEPRYDKPVLIYWLQAASVHLLGLNELALRLPSAIAASAWVLALWCFVRRHLDTRTATVAALTMALSLQVSLIAKAAVADAVLNLFIALTFFDIYRYSLEPRRGLALLAFLWMGLGFLTKGPVAVFFPLLVSLAFFLSRGDSRTLWRAAFNPLGWAIFLAVAGPWYLAIYLDNGAGFFESFFLKHNAGRFGGAIHGHSGSFFYYFAVLPLILLPFTGWFLRLLANLVPGWRQAWADPLDRFLWLWFITVFVFFSLSGTKLPHYMLYGATPLFILMARHRGLLTNKWLAFSPPLIFLALLFALPDILPLIPVRAERPDQAALFAEAQRLLDLDFRVQVGLGLTLALGIALVRPNAGWATVWQRLLLVGFVQTAVVYGVLTPRVLEVLQGPVKEAGLLAKGLDENTVVYRTSMPSFSVYREAVTPEVTAERPLAPGDLVFLRADRLASLARELPGVSREVVFQRGPVALVRLGAGANQEGTGP